MDNQLIAYSRKRWAQLIDPFVPIEDESLLRQTRFLAGLSLIVAVLVAITGLFLLPLALNPHQPYKTLVFWDAIFGVPLFFLGYYFARTGRSHYSILIMTWVSIIGPGFAGIDNFLFAVFMNVGVVFAIAFLETSYKYLTIIVNIGILILLGIFLPDISASDVIALSSFALLLSALMTLFDVFRTQAENIIIQMNADLEERVVARTEELQAANAEIKQFVYIVSHDFRSPLVNLQGFANELRYSLDEITAYLDSQPHDDAIQKIIREDIPEALSFIESSTKRMDHFTAAMLQLSRLGRRELHLQKVDLNKIVREAIDMLSHSIVTKKIEVLPSQLPIVLSDEMMQEQIFGNLLTNAVNYVVPERQSKIEIDYREDPEYYTICIKDNGRGISEDDYDKVFAPFRRAGKQDTAGEGMGLAYVQTLVRRLGGRIWFESQAGIGTTFFFTIPKITEPPL